MNISRKIEEIREKPEHIRMRYVWGGVAISMFFIVIIWIFSLSESFKSNDSNKNSDVLPDFKKSLEEASASNKIPSIQEMQNEQQKALEEIEKQKNQEGQEKETEKQTSINEMNNQTKEITNPLFPIE